MSEYEILKKGGKMLYCPECGNENPDDAKYCKDCGILIPELTIKETVNENIPSDEFYTEIVEKKVIIEYTPKNLTTCWSCGKQYLPSSNCPFCGSFRKRRWQRR